MLLSQAQLDKLHLAFFLGFKLRLMRVIILLHILIVNSDALIKISRPKSNDAHVEFVVAPLKIFVELAFRNCNACRQKRLYFVQAKLIANQLLDMLFAEPHRPQTVPHKIAELIHVEARFTLESWQLAHDIGNLSSAGTQTEPLRLMSQNQQVDDELDRNLILV